MTDQALTEIIAIIDSSGSMGGIRDDVIGGFNQFLADQKKVTGRAKLTYVQFNDRHDVIFEARDIQKVLPLDEDHYTPYGNTALYDTIGHIVNRIGTRYASTPEHERPGKVVVLIMTDGAENSSREFHYRQIKDMIEHQQSKYQWQFLYIGANQDAFAIADSIGIPHASAAHFLSTRIGTQRAYERLAKSVTAYRQDSSPVAKAAFDPADEPPSPNGTLVKFNHS